MRFILLAALSAAFHSLSGQSPTLDTSFDPGDGALMSSLTSGIVHSVRLQPDGKLIVVGNFASYDGTARRSIARINSDGSIDPSFNPGSGAGNGVAVYCCAIQNDGKVLIGGQFIQYNGTARSKIARVNADGSLDTSFDPGSGANNSVFTLIVQPDEKIIIGGSFTQYNGISRNGIARLNADGSLDSSFDPIGGAWAIHATVRLTSGQILAGGMFDDFNGVPRHGITRLNSDGSLDMTFDPGGGATGSNPTVVKDIIVQPDDKIVLAGWFTEFDGAMRRGITRLEPNGSLDTGFATGTGTLGQGVESLLWQSSGKVLIGGSFGYYDGAIRQRIALLNTDGTLDLPFVASCTGQNSPNIAGRIYDMVEQPDGKILVAGDFTHFNGTSRTGIARIYGDAITSIDAPASVWATVAPNPTHGLVCVTLNAPCEEIFPARLYASNGSLVASIVVPRGSTSFTVDLAGLPPGLYTLRAEIARQQTQSTRLVHY